MSSNSLITSEFSGIRLTGIAYTNVSLDKPVLKYQPLNNVYSESMAPLPLEPSSKPSTIVWIDDVYFIVLYENKPYFDLMDSNNMSKVSQHIDLVISSTPASCSCATFDSKKNILYLMDTSNRLYIYSFDKFADLKLEKTLDYVVTELSESVSKIALSTDAITDVDNNKLLLMSNALYEFDVGLQQIERSINLFVETTNCFQVIDNYLLISSSNDRFINLIDLTQFKVQSIFVLNSPIVKFMLTKYKGKCILAAINEDGFIEFFKDALNTKAVNGDSATSTPNSKRRRRNNKIVSSIQSISTLKLYNNQNGEKSFSKIDNIIFDHDKLTIAYLQNENYFVVDNFNWFVNKLEDSEILIEKKKNSMDRLKVVLDDKASLNTYSETNNVTIRSGDNFIDLDPVVNLESKEETNKNKGNEEQEEEEGDDDDDDDFSTLVSRLDKSTNTLGGKLKSSNNNKNGESSRFRFQVGTLTTNISQALRNNDTSMFDQIISSTYDENIVRTTVSQLEQNFVLKMLDKLAELVYKNKFKNTTDFPELRLRLGSRTVSLTAWIRYVLIYHGTYLIGAANSNSDLRRRLGLLGMSLERRANNINRLLELKGRLGMVTMKVAVTKEFEKLDTNAETELDEEDVEYIEDAEDVKMMSEDEDEEGDEESDEEE